MHHLELKTFTRNTNCVHNIDNSVAKALDDREEGGILHNDQYKIIQDITIDSF
jgi:hypothetical protein